MKHLFITVINFIFLITVITVITPHALALDSTTPNNKFGIHLAQPSSEDLKSAAQLINSTGGRWGYVTLVIQENDRDKNKWQSIFDEMRELRLIPIIRIATQPEGASWKRATAEDANVWAGFLNSLHWVVKDRYVIIFNEVNHASEWGGAVDPKGYGEVAYAFAKTLKETNPDFFTMIAGFDAAAPQRLPTFADEAYYLREMNAHLTSKGLNIFEYIDGWSSHSYPNPGFSGSPYSEGRNTIRTYEWERAYLRSLGITKELPIFITETGWLNDAPTSHYKYAYEQVWLKDPQVFAVTPFVLSYIGEPFSRFSWRKEGDIFYPHFDEVKGMEKLRGDPVKIDTGSLLLEKAALLVAESSYNFTLDVENTGQAIWDVADGYYFGLEPATDLISISHNLRQVKPFSKSQVNIRVQTTDQTGKATIALYLYRKDQKVATAGLWNVEVVPVPSLTLRTQLFGKKFADPFDVEVQVYDKKEQLIYTDKEVTVENGSVTIPKIPGVVLGQYYRVVILRPYYLPRQNYVQFQRNENRVLFEPMLPFDFDADGKFDLSDVTRVVTKPSLFTTLFGL